MSNPETQKIDRKCKCPFDHYIAPPSREKGSTPHPNIHEFDNVVEKFPLQPKDEYAIEIFKDLIKIPSISGDVPKDNATLGKVCCEWFGKICDLWGISYRVMEFTSDYPVFVATVPGSDDSLTSILLNNHYDVVPVELSKWNYPTFDAVEENNYIIGRGAQDMKSICIAQLIALIETLIAAYKALPGNENVDIPLDSTPSDVKKKLGQLKLLKRTIHFSSMPDEEVGGTKGMLAWLQLTQEEADLRNKTITNPQNQLITFDSCNIEFFMDEGLASTKKSVIAFYNERCVWWLRIVASSTTGHGSRFIQDTAVEKIMCAVNSLYAFRDAEFKKLHGESTTDIGCSHAKAHVLGDVTTVNCTMLEAGVKSGADYAYNVIPSKASAGFDIRITQSIDIEQFEKDLRAMLPDGCEIEFVVKTPPNGQKAPSPQDDKYWQVVRRIVPQYGLELEETFFPSATDSRHATLLRPQVKRCGFSPLFNSPMMLHDHDERINKYIFIKACQIMTDIVKDLAKLD